MRLASCFQPRRARMMADIGSPSVRDKQSAVVRQRPDDVRAIKFFLVVAGGRRDNGVMQFRVRWLVCVTATMLACSAGAERDSREGRRFPYMVMVSGSDEDFEDGILDGTGVSVDGHVMLVVNGEPVGYQ